MMAHLPDGTADASSWKNALRERGVDVMTGVAKIDQPHKRIKGIGITTLIIIGIVIYWILK